VPGGDPQAFRLVLVSIFVAMAALIVSEWASKAVARRISGA
jgi:molybdate transport system permease protein